MDQFYFEEGYLEAKYFVYIGEAKIDLTPYIESGFIDANYWEYYGSDAILVCDAEIVAGVIVEASGSWTTTASINNLAYKIVSLSAAWTSTASISSQINKFVPGSSALEVQVSQSATATRIIEALAAFDAVWTSSLTATAFKNHTAILDTTTAMSVDAVANRSANVLLDYLADLNAMSVKIAVVDSAITITSTQTSNPTKLVDASSTVSSSVSISADATFAIFFDATLTSSSTLFTSKYAGTGRPWNVTNTWPNTPILSIDDNWDARVKEGQSWLIEFDVDLSSPTLYYFKIGPLALYRWNGSTTSTTGNYIRLSIEDSNGTLHSSTSQNVGVITSGDSRITILYQAGDGRLGIYKNGSIVVGTRVGPFGWSFTWKKTSTFKLDIPSTVYGSISNFNFRVGDTYNYNVVSDNLPSYQTPTNDPTYTKLLLDSTSVFNGIDNTTVSHSGSAALTAQSALTAQANPNTKQVESNVAVTTNISATPALVKEFNSNLSADSQLATNAGKLKGIISDLTVNATESINYIRYRDFDATNYALFSPSITINATKVGEIVLVAEFTLTTDANSYSNVPADLTATTSITCAVDGIPRITSANLINNTTLTTTIGRLQNVSIALDNVFTASLTVEYFEGTALLAPMTSTMSVVAYKTARITKTLNVTTNSSTTARENPQAPAANPIYTTYQERIDVNISYTYTYVKSSSIRRSFYFTSDTAIPGGQVGIGALEGSSLFPDGSLSINSASANVAMYVYEYGNSGSSHYYDVYVYTYNLGVVDSVNTGAQTFVNGSGSIRLVFDVATPGLLTAYLDGSSTPLTLPAPTKTYRSRITWPNFEPYAISNVNGIFGWPQILFPTVSNIQSRTGNTNLAITSSSISDEAYIPHYGPQEYTVADLKELGSNLTALPYTAVFLNPASINGTFAQTTAARRFRTGTTLIQSQSTVYANAGKSVRGMAASTVTSTITVQGDKVSDGVVNISTTAAINCAGERIRYFNSNQSVTAAQTVTAAKRTGNIIAIDSTVDQTTNGYRVRYNSAEFTAFYSSLTAVAKNATGTVLLESTTTLTASAVKNGFISTALNSTASMTVEIQKVVGFDIDLNAQATITAEALRIQPAGADLTVSVTETAVIRKITGYTIAANSSITLVANADRFRDTIALEAGEFTIICDNQVLRLAQADLYSSFYNITISPTNIIRITADWTAFYSHLTAGDVINLDPALTYVVPKETREFIILPESREYAIEAETRELIILKG